MNNIIFIAPPAAGKGTQAELLEQKYNIAHISFGDLLRNEVNANTEIGKQVKNLMDQGLLVDDKITFELLEKRLSEKDCANGYILDGFPRNLEQAKAYEEIAKRLNCQVSYVILLDIKKEEALKRIAGRITCPSCGAVYNEYFDTFKKPGICNVCSSQLIKRSDDNEETFNQRFNVYLEKTQPVIEYYKNKGLLHVVDSSGSKEETFSKIINILDGGNK